MRTKVSLGALAVGLVALALPGSAGAATQVGSTFNPGFCSGGSTYIQAVSPSNSYAAPFDGVITSWRFFHGFGTPHLKLKVARLVGAPNFLFVGSSGFETPVAGLNTFQTRVPVLAGDVIGIYTDADTGCSVAMASGHTTYSFPGDATPGPPTPPTGSFISLKLDVAAALEPDADGDGFGDETQDQCPAQTGPNNGCPDPVPVDSSPPNASITKGPKAKTKKKTATFEFTGTDARAVASFQCSLDGGAFTTCTSPHTVKVKKGKHTFEVQAIDQAGNVGAPASDTWKRKKKR